MTSDLVILKEEMQKLAKLPRATYNEVTGVSVYHIATKAFPYDSIGGSVITGMGSPGKITSDDKILSEVNRFFDQNTNYGYVDFHTHSVGTIEEYGEHYAYNFSDADESQIRKNGLDNPDYRQMLITPKRVRLVRYDRRTDSIIDLPIPRQVDVKVLYTLREYISRFLDVL